MYISRVEIQNFRNFCDFEIDLKPYSVIVGANKAGKSNFLHAIRLAIDPDLGSSQRKLDPTDFWQGVCDPPCNHNEIIISVELYLTDNEAHLFSGALKEPNIARFTYKWQPHIKLIENSDGEQEVEEDISSYEYLWRMGNEGENKASSEYVGNRLTFHILDALRDINKTLSFRSSSPLLNILRMLELDVNTLDRIAKNIHDIAGSISNLAEVTNLKENINKRSDEMVGQIFSVEAELNVITGESDDLLKSVQLFVENNRSVDKTSVGTQNILYLALLLQEIQVQGQAKSNRQKTPPQLLLALEEPEAHVHPHIQRAMFDYFSGQQDFIKSLIITTHSPHVASVSPIESICVIRNYGDSGSKAKYIRDLLDESELMDIRRYMDVMRSELLFSRGIIFVEGIAEQFLIPIIASKLLDSNMLAENLDHLGISVISVHSTNFIPFVKLVAPQNFDIPYVVLTDGDPYLEVYMQGKTRAQKLLKAVTDIDSDRLDLQELATIGHIYVNKYTFEIELILHYGQIMLDIIGEHVSDNMYSEFVDDFNHVVSNYSDISKMQIVVERILNRITNYVGKGRLAQLLSIQLDTQEVIEGQQFPCPNYITDSVLALAKQIGD